MSLGAPPVAYLVVMESPNDSFRVMLPDGRVAMQMYTDLNPTKRWGGPLDRGSCALGYPPDGRSFRLTHEFGSLDCCIGKEPKKVLNFSTGEPSLELDPPPNPWMLPFLVFTACLGACWHVGEHKMIIEERYIVRGPTPGTGTHLMSFW